jgi:5S rRNA maturation endonuclease (ribonuclease M5)
MGSFSQITFADYPVFDNKNWYYPEIVNSLFLPDDFICEKRKYSTRNRLVWGDAYESEKGTFEFKGYRQTVKVCRDRLEIFGASYKKAKQDFQKAKKISRQEGFYDFSLSSITYDQYLAEIESIVDSKEKTYDNLNINFRESLMSGELGIYGLSLDSHLHSILSVLSDNDFVEYDLTDVINGGWVDEDQAKYVDYEKIIILTEGKSDVEFISKSIEKLYPHLKDYYHFIDFDEYKVESSASALVKLITSFAAANVKHPIIALFDNDTAGLKEMKKLTSKKVPPNIKILKYPDITLAKKYPTVGPTGKKRMNVNGFACSIEMYFGVDVLTRNNELIPIQWKGYEDKEKKYQGEIADKNYVQDTFRKKLKKTEVTEINELTDLLNEIFNAYKQKPSP